MSEENILKGLGGVKSIEINGTKVNGPFNDTSVKFDGVNIQIGNQRFNVNDRIINITVNGDVENVCRGNNITVKGDVDGDVECSAGNVEIGGDVMGDVETSAGNITVHGDVMGDVETQCGNIRR